MGNTFKKNKIGTDQVAPKQGAFFPFHQQGSFQNAALPYTGVSPATNGAIVPYYSKVRDYSLQNDKYSVSNDDIYRISQVTGWPVNHVTRLRREYLLYANQAGLIDRLGFLKLYIAGLINKPWHVIELDAAAAFQQFDTDETGSIDFKEYVIGCLTITAKK